MLKPFSGLSSTMSIFRPIPSHQIRMKHSTTQQDLNAAANWYVRFHGRQIRRKHGEVTSSGNKVNLRYPISDLLRQIPALFHEETKKLKQIKGKEIIVTCQKHTNVKENEEVSWEMVATLIDKVASRVLPASATKHRPSHVKERIQKL